MAKQKQHLDDFLRERLNDLPNAPVAGFEKVEKRMAVKNHRGVVLLVLIPLLFLGIYWLTGLTEQDLVVPAPQNKMQPVASPDADQVTPINLVQPEELGNESVTVVKEPTSLPVNPEPIVVAKTSKKSAKPEVELASVAKPINPDLNAASNMAKSEVIESENAFQSEEYPAVYVDDREVAIVQPQAADVLPATENLEEKTGKEEVLISSKTSTAPMLATTSRWSVLANFYPNYTFREFNVSPAYQNQVHDRYEEIVKASERGGFAFNVGVDVRYLLGKGVYLGSGLGYIEMKVNGRYDFNIYEQIATSKSETELVGKTESVSALHAIPVDQGILQRYRYLQVPLHIVYQTWATDKMMILVEGGMSYVRFLGADGTTIDYETLAPVEISNMDYNKNLSSIDFKVGFAYFITNQVAFGLQPSFMYFTKSIYSDESPLSVIPWSVGVNFNLTMRLY